MKSSTSPSQFGSVRRLLGAVADPVDRSAPCPPSRPSEPRSPPRHRPLTRVDPFVQVACCGVGAAAACAPRRHDRHAAGTRARVVVWSCGRVFRVQSSEFILVKTDKLTRKALTEPLPANSGPRRYTSPPPHRTNAHVPQIPESCRCGDYPPGRRVAKHTSRLPLLCCCSSTGGEQRM